LQVREAFAGRELGRVAVEEPQILLRRGHFVRSDRQDVVVDVVALGLLVDVVADAGAVGEQILDRDVLGDQRKVVAEHRACGRV
jgi:hypothetical protein